MALDQLNSFLEFLETKPLLFFNAFAAVGILTMALVEVYKTQLLGRRNFNKAQIESALSDLDKNQLGFLSSCLVDAGVDNSDSKPESPSDQALQLLVGSENDAFYDQPIDQLINSYREILPTLLDYPRYYRELIYSLLFSNTDSSLRDFKGLEQDFTYLLKGKDADGSIRRRLISRARASLDGIENSMHLRWKSRLKGFSFAISFAILIVPTVMVGNLVTGLSLAIFGALVAPFARDIVVAVSNARDVKH